VVSGRVKADLLQRADLFSLPSQGEGLSMAVLEAMANATPVVISPECHFGDAETAGAGVVVGRDAEAIAGALRRLASDRSRLGEMGAAGRRFVEREYSWDAVIDRLIEVYSLR
jgi:glycosyltransferase involved in cell wall biosynthesis